MQDLPIYMPVFFVSITLGAVAWFYQITKAKKWLLIVSLWALLQAVLALLGVYQNTKVLPPRIVILGVLPAILAVIATFSTVKGRAFIDNLDLKALTYFHSIRILVEICLSLLFYHGVISVYTTFEGTNFDILSGLTAPIVAYWCFRQNYLPKNRLIAWNLIALLLLFNVVITAVLAFPSPFQQLAFDQPNIAPLYFPFIWLPTLVVPLVLFCHLVALRQLLIKPSK